MKAAVRYYTQTGNTKKLTDAIAAELGIEAKSIDTPLEEDTSILFQREFHCQGSFKALHKGKPNAEDLKAVSAFARSVVE